MKIKMKPVAAAVALSLLASSAMAAEFYIAAKAYDKTMPDGSTVPMWGYVEDTGGLCYNAAGAAARLDCINNQLLSPTFPGPRLTVPVGDDQVRIFLSNGLPEPTSIMITGQALPSSSPTESGPTWNDNTTGPRTSELQRVRSFGLEAGANGGREPYVWVSGRGNPFSGTGSFIYQTATHPQKQLYMGLAGMITRNAAPGEAYPGVAYDNEVTLFYSDIDPDFNAAVNAGTLTTAIDRHPSWFLINGEPYDSTMTDIAAGAAGSNTLLRMASTTTDTHVAVLQGLDMAIHAEDGVQYTWQELGVGGNKHPAPRTQYSAMLPPAKTKDAIVVAPTDGRFAVYDGNGYMSNPSDLTVETAGDSVGGMLRFLAFGASSNLLPVAVADSNSGTLGDPDLTGNVLTNDTAGDAPATVTLADQGGTAITIGSPFVTTAGNTLTLNADGSYSYSTANVASESFNYTITDNNGDSSSSTLSVTVASTNVAPVADAQSVMLDEDGSLAITLTASDGNSDPLTYTVGTGPANGALDSTTTPNLIYTPNANFNGADSFTFTVNDGTVDSLPATVSITVNPVNDAPVADSQIGAQALTTDQGVAIPVTLTASDVDGDALTYTVNSPANGTLNGTAPNLTYTPNAGYSGPDSFTFTVNDGTVDSAPATVDITVNAVGAQTASIAFSTAGAGAVPGVSGPYDDADIYSVAVYSDETSNVYTRLQDGVSNLGLPNNADIDGMEIDGANIYVSFAAAITSISGFADVPDEDVVVYNGGSWSTYFDGTQCGLDGSNGQDIDALAIVGGTMLYFSTAGGGNGSPVSGVSGPYDDADIYTWNGTSCGRALDGSAVGLAGNADIDALSVIGGTYYISFRAATTVPGLGAVPDEAVVSYDGANWALVFTGTGQLDGANSQNVDAIDVTLLP